MATENILMDAVLRGGDRQELHEKIRLYSMEAAKQVKEEGLENDLIQRMTADAAFGLSEEMAADILQAEHYTGRAAEQTEEYVEWVRETILSSHAKVLGMQAELNV